MLKKGKNCNASDKRSHVCYVAVWFVPELAAQFDNMPHVITDISRYILVCC